MSLAVSALRIATIKALTGATSAESRVYDSEVSPIDLLGDKALPTIIVYTDTGHIDLKDRAVFDAPETIDLTIEMFIGRTVTVKNGEGEDVVQLAIPNSDSGYETYLQTLRYEVKRALFRRDGSPWPELWAELIVRGSQGAPSQWDRGANSDNARRFAFLRLVYRVEVLNDPIPGAPLNHVWTNLLAAMDADSELDQISAYWRSLITDPAVPGWRQAQIELGLTDAGIQGIGIAPMSQTSDDPLPASAEIAAKLDEEPTMLTVDPDQATLGAATLAEGQS